MHFRLLRANPVVFLAFRETQNRNSTDVVNDLTELFSLRGIAARNRLNGVPGAIVQAAR